MFTAEREMSVREGERERERECAPADIVGGVVDLVHRLDLRRQVVRLALPDLPGPVKAVTMVTMVKASGQSGQSGQGRKARIRSSPIYI